MYKLIYNLHDHGSFETFEDAFKRLFALIKDEDELVWQLLETACWIENTKGQAIPFYDARDLAYDKGLLVDGKPTWK